MNTAFPDRLERVFFVGPGGIKRSFRTFLARADVSAALSLKGRFGFAVPIAALRDLGPVIRVMDANGALLSGGEAVRLPPEPTADEAEAATCVLLHIQKTAGTSLRQALVTGLPLGRVLSIYEDGATGIAPEEMSELSHVQLAALRLVIGHSYFGVGDCLPGPVEYAAVLRSPLARLQSHYYHHVSAGTAYCIEDNGWLPTSIVVQHGLTAEFDNLMTRVIAGVGPEVVAVRGVSEAHVNLALQNIRTRFRFLGLMERLEEHYPRLCAALGINAGPMPVVNTRQIADPTALTAAVDWGEVMHHNRFDQMLYDRVQGEGLCGWDLRAGGKVAAHAG